MEITTLYSSMILFNDALLELELTSEAANKLNMSSQFVFIFQKISLPSTTIAPEYVFSLFLVYNKEIFDSEFLF